VRNAAVLALLLLTIEGLASYGLFVRAVMTTSPHAERRHTKYDADLGWANEPNVYIPDMYGPRVYLRTNAQGFRNNHEISVAVLDGRRRVVCSGDSFTFGYGVDNAHTWCELLSVLDPGLEPVNMGQGGYGVDQAYLWYKRDAAKLDHQVQILAFITEDFYRMLSDTFLGYGKPILEVDDGKLMVANVPVPRRAYYFTWGTQNIQNLKSLRTVEFLNRVLLRIKVATGDSHELTQAERDEKARTILRKIFEDLKSLNERRSSKLVLVYLPTIDELEGNSLPRLTARERWAAFLEEESRSLDVPLINLFTEFRSLPDDQMLQLFIQDGQLPYAGAAGHLNDAGNEFVAKMLHARLR
jgi:hypothetical protein